MRLAYVESSAAAKLVLREVDSDALRLSLRDHEQLVCSDLTRLEVARAAWRSDGDVGLAQARAAMLPIETIPIDRRIVDTAISLAPAALRSIDAIHVATALSLGVDDVTFYSYDARTVDAARAAGLSVASPKS
jgi:uncharacterized protein